MLGEVRDRAIRPAGVSLAAVAGVIAVGVTLLVAVVPGLGSAFRSASTNVAIDTAGTLALGLTSAIMAGRARQAARRSDLLLAMALLVTAVATLCFQLIPTLSADHTRTFVTWALAGSRVIAAGLFLAAALGPSIALERPARAVATGLLAAMAATGAMTGLIAALTGVLPVVDEPFGPHRVSRDLLGGPVSLTVLEILLTMALSAATAGFAIRSERRQDPLLGWIAAGVALFAIARLDYALFPTQYGEYVYIGDFVALAAFVVLLTGAAIEVLSSQEVLAEQAIREERRRLARDLHDGLAQELAFITAQTRRLVRDDRQAGGEDLLAAAQRALEESRLAISGLVRRGSEPLERTLEQAATSTAARAGVEVQFDLEPHIDVPPEVQQALLRVQSQAIVNAAVHGQARVVFITLLRGPEGLRLEVVDDGDGFDVDAPRRADSLGLLSMHERAQALGGSLRIRSRLGEGTVVELLLP
ncbi:MAG TPA: ATP-binding protein [Solirubrobacteraceae bacterium]|nr:ATP-binding protein [Solirubrobacteraceae bacterium]